jgi:hypothetical protein
MLTSNVFYPNVKEEIPVCCCFKIGQTGEIEFTTLSSNHQDRRLEMSEGHL